MISRRTLLAQFGLGAIAAAVAGCGGRTSGSAPTSTTSPGPSSAAEVDLALSGVAFDVRTEPG